jgi:hypothetical protein
MTLTIKTEKVGSRIYIAGNTYSVKDRLKSAGCHWDGERKQWWIGTAKAAKIESIVGKLDGAEVKQNLDEASVYGKVSYVSKSGKAGTYFVIGSSNKNGSNRLRLTNLAGSIDFWVDDSAVKWIKRYEGRDVGFRGYGNPANNTVEYQTLGGLRRFVESAKNETPEQRSDRRPSSDHVRCCHCNQWTPEGDDWCMACGRAGYER